MKMYNCRDVVYDEQTGKVKSVLAVVDAHGPFRLVTHVKAPYRTIFSNLYTESGDPELCAMEQHDNIRDALRFHRHTAEYMHEVGSKYE